MVQTFFFYDLETSGLNPREDRIMQFAGIRTTLDFKPVGEPYNLLVRLSDDTLPSPDALLITGISPQQTISDGYSEAEFARILTDEVFVPDTITIGFNNIRFDDEFIRYLFWRTFRDPYEWSYKLGCSRWDMLDVIRMTRALRPDGMQWPLDSEGRPTNRLELLSAANGIDHYKSHDALSDVEALIAVTKLLAAKQPQLYGYLFKMRDKNEIKKLVSLEDRKPFVYTSGRYDAEHDKTTVVFPLAPGLNGNVAVYDLRYNPTPYLGMSPAELAAKLFASWQERRAEDFVAVPVKELQYNRAPAVAPVGVLRSEDWQRIHTDLETIEKHRKILLSAPQFAANVVQAYQHKPPFQSTSDCEGQLYDAFLKDSDRVRAEVVRNATEHELAGLTPEFDDKRLAPLFLRYKARNYPGVLSESEAAEWEKWRGERIMKQLPGFMKSLQRLALEDTDGSRQFMLQELQLWAESVVPADLSGQDSQG